MSLLAWCELEETCTFSQHLSSFTSMLEPVGRAHGASSHQAWGQFPPPALTLAQVVQEDIKEGDADGLVAPAVLLNLSQHQLWGGARLLPGAPGPPPLSPHRAVPGREHKAVPQQQGQPDAPRPKSPAQPCLPRPTCMQPAKMLLVSFL